MFDDIFSTFTPNLRNYSLVKIDKNDNSRKFVLAKSVKKNITENKTTYKMISLR